jgi:hypothetical protein
MTTSTISKVNFELQSDLMATQRRDIPLYDGTLSNPYNALCLVDGEWMTFDDDYKMIRSADLTQAAGTVAAKPGANNSMPLFAEKGRYDVQANAEKKSPVIYMGPFEADTRVYDDSLNTGISAAGQNLKVAVISITVAGTARKFSGLIRHVDGDSEPIVGTVTRLPAKNGGKLRFRKPINANLGVT